MKKWIAILLVFLMAGLQVAVAEIPDLSNYTDEELVELAAAVEAEQKARGFEEARATLQVGSKGEEVRLLQVRLIELNYLSGSADGDYGNKTKSAVELFQKDAGLAVTGIADPDTQTAVFADDAPVAKVYLSLDFKAISRDPGSYEGKNYKFTGKVLQVMEEEYENMTYVVMRIATKGNYDDVVYVTYFRDAGEARILEDDRVTVHGTCLGLYTYETVIGGSVTLPEFLAETVTLV